MINYYYDLSDNVIGFEYSNNKYLYLKNIQNDIIGIVDETGNLVVEYTYDAYGNIIKLVDTSNCNLSAINPFRYRSYYYDKETGWYYLNSRYYKPIIGRFITMDSIEYLGATGTALSYNRFTYCENDPVNNADPDGNLKLNSGLSIGFGIASILLFVYGMMQSIKSIFKLTNKNKLTTILFSLIMLLPINAIGQMILYYINNFISVITTAIIAANTALMVASAFTGGIAKIIFDVSLFVLGCYLPNIYKAVEMISNGIKGRSYDMKLGFLSASYKLQ